MDFDKNHKKSGLKMLAFAFAVVCLLLLWQHFREKEIDKSGVYSKGTITEVLGYKGGIRIVLEYLFQGKKYSALTSFGSGERLQKGDQFFVKFLPDDPKKINFTYTRVPGCLRDTAAPFEGWKVIPSCE